MLDRYHMSFLPYSKLEKKLKTKNKVKSRVAGVSAHCKEQADKECSREGSGPSGVPQDVHVPQDEAALRVRPLYLLPRKSEFTLYLHRICNVSSFHSIH